MEDKEIKKLNIQYPGLIYQQDILDSDTITKILTLFNEDSKNKVNIINENYLIYWNGIKQHDEIDKKLFNILKKYLQLYLNYYNQVEQDIIDSGYLLINHDKDYISNWIKPLNFIDNNINICTIIYCLNELQIEFKFINKKIDMKIGSMIIFPNNFMYTYKINNYQNKSIIVSTISYSKKP